MRKILLALLAGVLLAGGVWWIRSVTPASPPKPVAAAVPVVIGTAMAATVPIVLRGIGTLQAHDTVTIESRVDGPILAANFSEGQLVHKGDLLFLIDPRPYQAALVAAQAAETRDAAPLVLARLEFGRIQKLEKIGEQSQEALDAQNA